MGIETIDHSEGWFVTDLRGQFRIDPYWSATAGGGSGGVTVAEEDVRGLETYFWQAPNVYTGNKLTSYGQVVTVQTSWHRGRGDTAGTATLSPDIVIQVGN